MGAGLCKEESIGALYVAVWGWGLSGKEPMGGEGW